MKSNQERSKRIPFSNGEEIEEISAYCAGTLIVGAPIIVAICAWKGGHRFAIKMGVLMVILSVVLISVSFQSFMSQTKNE